MAAERPHEPVACNPGPPVNKHTFTQAEKDALMKQYNEAQIKSAFYCGVDSSDPIHYLQVVFSAGAIGFAAYSVCTYETLIYLRLQTMINKDPPDPRVSLVALPIVPAAKGKPSKTCPFAASTCRRGAPLALAYLRSLGQAAAAIVAEGTSLNRLATAPATPEDLTGNPPMYSLRLQAAAAELYSGLLAAWSERLQSASTKFARFLRGLGGNAAIAAKRLPKVLPASLLWPAFHRMDVYELAQLTEDLISQQVHVPLANYAKHHAAAKARIARLLRQLNSVHSTLERDLSAIRAASSRTIRTQAANRFARDANRITGIRGLATYAPHAPLTTKLLAFAAGALTTRNPKPVTAP